MASFTRLTVEETVLRSGNSFRLAVRQQRPFRVSCVDCSLPNFKDALCCHATTLDGTPASVQAQFEVSSRKVVSDQWLEINNPVA